MFTQDQTRRIDDFKFFMMWGESTARELDVLCPIDVMLAVNKAYIDMQPRTIKGLGLTSKNGQEPPKDNPIYIKKIRGINKLKSIVINGVINIIKNCDKDACFDQVKFDILHKELCVMVQNKFNRLAKSISNGIRDKNLNEYFQRDAIDKIKFGKAQKIVNMTFKYLSLFDNAGEHSRVFDFCHVAIDSYIIASINKDYKDYKENVEKDSNSKQDDRLKTLFDTAWSNYTYQDYKAMLDLQREMGVGKILFFEEFDWWKKHLDNAESQKESADVKQEHCGDVRQVQKV